MLGLLFRFPPIVYFLLAPTLVIIGMLMFSVAREDDAARAKALSHGAPQPVAIEAYDMSRSRSDWNEVTILAQLDLASMSEVVESKNGDERGRTTYGLLFPVTASSNQAPASGVMVIGRKVSDDEIKRMIVKDGTFGPIIRVNGVADPYQIQDSKMKLGLERGSGVAANAIFLRPFMNGREAELGRPSNAIGILIASLVFAVGVGGYGLFRRHRNRQFGISIYSS